MASSTTTPKVWLVTGASSGLGREISRRALAQGDIVFATGRNPARIPQVLTAYDSCIAETFDVTSPDAVLAETVSRIVSHPKNVTGRIDIVVNAAGYVFAGGCEEASAEEAFAQFNTNVLGQLAVGRAVLPVLRRQKAGILANFGSILSYMGPAGAGLYSATKAACSILSEALTGEVQHLGVKVTCIEPGYFRTSVLDQGHLLRPAKTIDEYRGENGSKEMQETLAMWEARNNKQPGDPAKLADVVVDALSGNGVYAGRELPARLLIGDDAYGMWAAAQEKQKKQMEEWRAECTGTDITE
ncbi:hypothetical protein QBC32DRAFT_342624 [Pseudoneurospora amorphoporcata]|uniref:Ketoreductase domain-containing protein n=1 Tax=Pseudoneurospora amorphoporcata TaxID=241081 RepID=A0AAN6SGB8_9PEZI|nr:hypothetical protein QBC32DRAFT_342624 [Pseudoneurospora amorphoporcata]